MTSQRLLVAVFTVSCIALSTGNHDNTTTLTYPGRVLNTTQGECPSDVQRETVIAEVNEDICNLLHQLGKWVHIYIATGSRPICKEMWSINCSCMLLNRVSCRFSDVRTPCMFGHMYAKSWRYVEIW